MDYQILKCLLNHEFWVENKQYLNESLFEDEIKELYQTLEEAHSKYDQDITTEELFALWSSNNPVATKADKANTYEAIKSIASSEALSLPIGADLVAALWRRETGRKAAEYGIAIAEGNERAFDKLDALIQQTKNGFVPEFGEEITKDILELIETTGDDRRWQFNIPSLSAKVYGIGPQEFCIVPARPETGKTAFGVGITAGPKGFLEQGAKVCIAGNEENPRRTMLRAVSAWSGMSEKEILLSPDIAKEAFLQIQDNLTIIGTQDWSMDQLNAYMGKINPDVLITDQLDKFSIAGDMPSHERLREIYIQGRAIANRHNLAHIAISQASNDAEGHTVVLPNMMEGSKTGKFAEADLIIGIGKYPDEPDGTPNNIRFLTVGKNKLNGYHGTTACKIVPELSRYVD